MADSFSKTVRIGDSGTDVKLAQEWLTYHDFATVVDGIFGPATEACVKGFQEKIGQGEPGVVDEATQGALLEPIQKVQARIPADNRPLGEMVVAYARQHLAEHPVEIGGQNAGPWVRLYMSGNEGVAWPWCAGFATFVLRQAAKTLGVKSPHPYAFGCDYLAGVAQGNGRLLRPKNAAELKTVKPGDLFLVRKGANHWAHIGVVEAIEDAVIVTIEGNTNDSGSAEGYEVCRRRRAIADKDYLVV
jgi:hypothetical protein